MKTLKNFFQKSFWIVLVCFCLVFPASVCAEKPITLRISSGVGDKHAWTAGHMQPFADRIEQKTNGKVKFHRFVAGELVKAGKSFEALRGGSIDVAGPFLAPYHAGVFPLTDVTMLPVLNTTTIEAARAFKRLVESDEPLKDGKTFYELEIESRGLVAWALAPTDSYIISTTGKRFDSLKDIKGTPLRGGARAHLIFIEALGATPVEMTAMDAYEAFSRGTVDGAVYSIPDWKAYGFTELFKYNITGISLGHWPSYLAVTKQTWDGLPADVQKIWNETADEMVMENADYWVSLREPTIKEAKEEYGTVFEDIGNLSPEVQEAIFKASVATWKIWIEREEEKGNPAKAAAKLWARLIVEEGGRLPEGVEAYLAE
jgi:TRAP-type C4-dicarboxylate transport system substrate-binding protein